MKPAILTRCSSRKLLKVNASLNNDQEFAIKNIHYGGLLHLSSYLLPWAFMVQILERFNLESCALWLHSGGIQTITPSDRGHIIDHTWGDTDWPARVVHHACILYNLVCFLCPSSKDVAGPKLYVALDDVLRLHEYDWPQFILYWLVNEVKKYKNRSSTSQTSLTSSFGGYLFLLMKLAFWTMEHVKEQLGLKANEATQGVYKVFVNETIPLLCQEQMEYLRGIDAILMAEG
ncbi:hypothetical protein LOK49_LG11G01310 [Camellia lanceoleosa]|uniref:Uncharacterized protein n=1 Tax=Camellia lanceoleosa TaxID=1840588 RepID=A0ACC0G8P1_9ERIC|nr:hypothetical protein LOK49_LG11G01310 [Camellia lanceoleosa]